MMQNINILAGGEPPKSTGNYRKDLEALMQYVERLTRALEIILETMEGKV